MKNRFLDESTISVSTVKTQKPSACVSAALGGNRVDHFHDDCRRKLALFGRLLHERHYISGCDGNLSVRLSPNCVLITPTGLSKRLMEPQDMVTVDLTGKKIGGIRAPSSEIGMHLTIYNLRPDVSAIVHAHPCTATGFACAGLDLTEPICSELILSLGTVPLARYAPPGSRQLSQILKSFICDHDAILLQNHGVVTYSQTLEQAYLNMETVEHCAQVMLATRLLGGSVPLSEREARRLHVIYMKKTKRCKQVARRADVGRLSHEDEIHENRDGKFPSSMHGSDGSWLRSREAERQASSR